MTDRSPADDLRATTEAGRRLLAIYFDPSRQDELAAGGIETLVRAIEDSQPEPPEPSGGEPRDWLEPGEAWNPYAGSHPDATPSPSPVDEGLDMETLARAYESTVPRTFPRIHRSWWDRIAAEYAALRRTP